MVTFPLSGMLSAWEKQHSHIGIQREVRSQRPVRGHADAAREPEKKLFPGVQTAGKAKNLNN